MSSLNLVTTEVTIISGAIETSLLITTLTNDPNEIQREARHKASLFYKGLNIDKITIGYRVR